MLRELLLQLLWEGGGWTASHLLIREGWSRLGELLLLCGEGGAASHLLIREGWSRLGKLLLQLLWEGRRLRRWEGNKLRSWHLHLRQRNNII
jgi:hypothetical protein